MKYIKIGEKKAGKYVKAEEFTMDEFRKYLSGITTEHLKCAPMDFWSRITGKTKKQEAYNIAYIEGYKDAKRDIVVQMYLDIDLDKKGKKIKSK